MFLAHDASSSTVITIFFLPTAIVFSKQSMQAQDNNDLGNPHFHDQLQDKFFLSSGYDGFTDGITGSNNNDMSLISRFLHITDPQYMTTTGSLPQSLMDKTGAAPSSSSSIPIPGPSSTSKPLNTGDDIHPLIPYSAQLDSFYHLPVPQLPAESSQPECPERQRRPQPSVTPYFIPEPRVSWSSQPTTTMAALKTMQPVMAPITIPAAVQPAMPALVIINVRPDVKKQIVDHAKQRIARFVLTTFAMAGTDDEKAALVSLAISEATSVPVRTLKSPDLHLKSIECIVVSEVSCNTKKCQTFTELQDSNVDIDEGCMSPVTQMKAVKEKEQWSSTSQQVIDDELLVDEPIEEVSDFQPSHDDEEKDREEEIKDDLEEPKSLSAETPVFVLRSKAKHTDFILTQPTWPSTAASKKLTWTAEPYPFPSSQPRTTKINKTQSACNHKQANETPVWADTQVVTSDEEPELMWTAESFPFPLSQPRLHQTKKAQSACNHKQVNETPVWEVVMSDEEPEAAMVSSDHSDSEEDDPDAPVECSGRPKLIWMDTDNTCAQVLAYYCLGPDCVNAVKALLVNHIYHYEQHFNEKNNPIPQSKRPYFTDILPYLMKGCYFNGLKSVGVNFSDHFKNIVNNKAQWPEVTIPMVALTSTLVYAALFWKANGSPSKFNFTGNLFSEVYFFHIKFLEDMKVTAPHKFHKMMANIFEAIQKLCTNSNTALVGSHESAMAFLDINSMDDKE
ncbi:hypothetical protein BDR04DRAFT_1160180 [Suillus decipiens]|nr:hypothetical protein BDR04DRAFT_1160180 [Suillus decipiens]